jgi:hypothetical protein
LFERPLLALQAVPVRRALAEGRNKHREKNGCSATPPNPGITSSCVVATAFHGQVDLTSLLLTKYVIFYILQKKSRIKVEMDE